MIERVCEWCGVVYSTRPERNLRYCSRACWREGKKSDPQAKTGICECCGKSFEYFHWYARKTCSKECAFRLSGSNGRRRKIAICARCGKVFECKAKRNTKFCSRACSDKGRDIRHTVMETVSCPVCGKEFERAAHWTSKSNRKRFCSLPCFNQGRKGQPIPKTCKQCGKPFEVAKMEKNRKFCSHECYSVWHSGANHDRFKGGYRKYYGPNWPQQRRLCRKRDEYKCRRCGIGEKKHGKQLNVHHIVPFRVFGIDRYREANELDNLIALCHTCHTLIEQGNAPLKLLLISNS